MSKRFESQSGTGGLSRMRWAAAGVVLVLVVLIEVYRWLVPYASWNPLWNQVTIGQSVIGPWKYGGQDEKGYLRFYNGFQTALLPPTAKLFDANGQFVILEAHTLGSLTYAWPIAAIPPGLLLVGLVGVGAGGFLWVKGSRHRRKSNFRAMRRARPASREFHLRRDWESAHGNHGKRPSPEDDAPLWSGKPRRFRAVRRSGHGSDGFPK